MEDKLVATTAKKPGNRVEACQLLATGQKLQTECRGREIPEELHEEGDPKAEELADRYHALLSAADGNVAKTETLCVCWDKLNSDLTELKSALRYVFVKTILREFCEIPALPKAPVEARQNWLDQNGVSGNGRFVIKQ